MIPTCLLSQSKCRFNSLAWASDGLVSDPKFTDFTIHNLSVQLRVRQNKVNWGLIIRENAVMTTDGSIMPGLRAFLLCPFLLFSYQMTKMPIFLSQLSSLEGKSLGFCYISISVSGGNASPLVPPNEQTPAFWVPPLTFRFLNNAVVTPVHGRGVTYHEKGPWDASIPLRLWLCPSWIHQLSWRIGTSYVCVSLLKGYQYLRCEGKHAVRRFSALFLVLSKQFSVSEQIRFSYQGWLFQQRKHEMILFCRAD